MKIKLIQFKSVKSTNNTALRLIKKNIYKPTMVVSKKQTKGKGTMGKKWVSLSGNLFISIFFEIEKEKINFKQFAILNAFIMRKITSKLTDKNIKIKWPNDLLLNNEKICGILQEVINFKEKNFLIVGIGLNTNIVPKNKSFSSTSIKNILGRKINNIKTLKIIKKEYEEFLAHTMRSSYSNLKEIYK